MVLFMAARKLYLMKVSGIKHNNSKPNLSNIWQIISQDQRAVHCYVWICSNLNLNIQKYIISVISPLKYNRYLSRTYIFIHVCELTWSWFKWLQNKYLNLLVRIKLLNLFLFKVLNKNWKMYWWSSWRLWRKGNIYFFGGNKKIILTKMKYWEKKKLNWHNCCTPPPDRLTFL